MARPLPNSLSLISDFLDDGMNRFDRLRDFRDVVGVDDGVGNSLVSNLAFDTEAVLLLFNDCNELSAGIGALIRSFGCSPCALADEFQFLPGDPCICISFMINSPLLRSGMWWLDADNEWYRGGSEKWFILKLESKPAVFIDSELLWMLELRSFDGLASELFTEFWSWLSWCCGMCDEYGGGNGCIELPMPIRGPCGVVGLELVGVRHGASAACVRYWATFWHAAIQNKAIVREYWTQFEIGYASKRSSFIESLFAVTTETLTILKHCLYIQTVGGTCFIIRTTLQVIGQFAGACLIYHTGTFFIYCI